MMARTFFICLAILEIGLFVIGPALQRHIGPLAGNIFYVLLRVVVVMTFSFLCVKRYGKTLFQALSATGFLLFFDQVGFKSLWLMEEIHRNPSLWQGVDPKTALYNNAFSYMVSLPLILLLAFIGALPAIRTKIVK